MKTLVIYDSLYGNTKKVAETVSQALETEAVSVKEADPTKLTSWEFLIVGTPTHGGRPKPDTMDWLKRIPEDALKGVKVAVFDTRIKAEEAGFFLRIFASILGYAAPRMAKTLKNKGAELAGEPEGFFVEGKEGPMKEGELERAKNWAKEIAQI